MFSSLDSDRPVIDDGDAAEWINAQQFGCAKIHPGGWPARRHLVGTLRLMPGTAIVRVPDELSLNTISPSRSATATIAAAFESADTLQDRTICITGAGLLGLTASAMARSRGAAAVIMCELHEERRVRAKQFGATHCVAPDELSSVLKEVIGGHGVDVALEVSGPLRPFIRFGHT